MRRSGTPTTPFFSTPRRQGSVRSCSRKPSQPRNTSIPRNPPRPRSPKRSTCTRRPTKRESRAAASRLAGGGIAHFNSSWCVRVRRDDLVTFQVDGTRGSAVAGLTRYFTQSLAETPRPVWNPDVRQAHDFGADWKEVPDDEPYDNAFKAEWELFIRHVCEDMPFKWNLLEGAKGLQLVDCALKSWRWRRWVDVPRLKA